MGFRTHLSGTHDTFMDEDLPVGGSVWATAPLGFAEFKIISCAFACGYPTQVGNPQMGPGQKGPGKPIFSAEIIGKHTGTTKNN